MTQPRTALRRVAAYFGDGPLVVEDGIITRPEAAAPLRAIREAMKNAIRALPALKVRDTDAVPQLKRRPDAGIDRAAALLAIEHVELPVALAVPSSPALTVEALALLARWLSAWRAMELAPPRADLVGDTSAFLAAHRGAE